MQRELTQILRDECDEAGVVRTRRDLTEDDVIALDEHLHAEEPATSKSTRDGSSHVLGSFEGLFRHRMRLPGLAVVALDLRVAYRRTKRSAARMTHREHGDLVIELDEAFDDDFALAGASAFLRILPRIFDVGRGFNHALAFATAAHDGLHHAGHADLFNGSAEFLLGARKDIRRGLEAQIFRREPADAFAIHREFGCTSRGDDIQTLRFEFDECVGGDGFDLRHDERGIFHLDEATQRLAIEHGDHMAAMRHLHGGGIGIAIDGDDLAAEALQLDDDFFAELPGTEEHDFGGGGGKRGADGGHAGM